MLDSSLVAPLLLTKLQRPRISRELVQRPHLLERLQSLQGLILVIAPAGYGKTTLLSAWLDHSHLSSVWLTLDGQDNDLHIFVSYLIAAVQTRFATVGVKTAGLLKGQTPPPLAVITRCLLDDLAAIKQDFILVLDDYHVIRDSAIHHLLSDLLHDAPRTLHFVLAARIDPALPLPELRSRGHTLELRAADLRFTLDETARFLREAMRLQVDDQDVSVLRSRTEGWAAGLHLAALYFRHSGARTLLEANQQGQNRYIIDYLVVEVLAQLPPPTQDFLLQTSILDELCGPLCEAVMGLVAHPGDGQTQLEWLQHADLFLTALGGEPQWYSYQHLFRHFLNYQLRRRYSAEEIGALHRRASAWFAANGYLDEALQHALTASDMAAAVQIVAQHRHELMNQAQWQRLERWVRLFPRAVIDEQPDLLLIEVWMKFIQQQLNEMSALLDRVEVLLLRLPPDVAEPLWGEVETRRSGLYYFDGDVARSLDAAHRALEKIPAEWWYLRGYMRATLSGGYLLSGDLERAYAALYAPGEPQLIPEYRRHLIGSACFIHWIAADLPGMAEAARRVLAETDQSNPAEIVTWSQHHLGLFHYQLNELAAAEKYLTPLVAQPYASNANCFLNSAVLLARIRQAQGRPEEAQEIANALSSFALETHSEVTMFAAQAFQAELALRQGRLAEASRWAEQHGSFRRVPTPFAFVPAVVTAVILLAQDTPASRRHARQLLTQMDDFFTAIHYTVVRIRVTALQAMLYHAEGEEQQALAALEKSIALAEPGGFVRAFVDLGAPLLPLLQKLSQRGVSPAYLADVIAAFDAEDSLPIGGRGEPAPAVAPPRSAALTPREQEVLMLLARRYTDREIAEALTISPETVRSHVTHLGDKLGVRGRRAIVRKAKDQGLFA